MPLTVVIADDEPLARERLRTLLAEQPGTEVVAEVGDGLAALQAVAELRPDLVLLDISMPGSMGWKRRVIWRRSIRGRRWCSAPPTMRMRCRRSRPRRSTT